MCRRRRCHRKQTKDFFVSGPSITTSGSRPAAGKMLRVLAVQLSPLLALLVVIVFFAVADARMNEEYASFLSVDTARMVAVNTIIVGTAALGMLMIIVSGGIDLSAGTALAFSATVLAFCLKQESGVVVALFAAVGTGCLTGLLNGALISLLRVVPFIITLGTMSVYLGFAKLIADETTIRPNLASIPDWLKTLVTSPPDQEWLAYPLLPNFAPGVWLFLALAGALAFVLRSTVFGRYVFAVGSNEQTARLCGINVTAMKIAVYTLAGLFVGIAGILQFARLSNGNPTSGRGLELSIIAAVVVGGASLSGGRGSVLGTMAGALLMVVINVGCTALGLRSAWQDVTLGTIIFVAAAFDQLRQRRLSG